VGIASKLAPTKEVAQAEADRSAGRDAAAPLEKQTQMSRFIRIIL
jgi:hypothetical protein